MGKGFNKNKLKIIAAILIAVLPVFAFDTYASYREIELFDEGYENYLSYQPEKAVEAFTKFLEEFPNSSAKDAAMFWLGKALIQIKSFGEAKGVFNEIKRQFPESPMIPYADRELEKMGGTQEVNETGSVISEAVKGEDIHEIRLAEAEKKEDLTEKKRSKVSEDSKKQNLLQEERGKREETKTTMSGRRGDAESKKLSESDRGPRRNSMYTVQVGALKNRKAANLLKVKLERTGYKENGL